MPIATSEAGSSKSCLRERKMFQPGFRFHPTDEELVLYYLKRKICRRRLRLDIIGETDVYKCDPQDLPGLCKLKTGDRQWFFFSPRDRKYPNGARSNRGTPHGYWKATGKDRTITCNSRSVGIKKTLVFYRGRAPSGERTDWVMHEYTVVEEELKRCPGVQDYFALYKVYKKSGPGPKNGEQYGAPFREEEWADDDCSDFIDLFEQENFVQRDNEVVRVDNTERNAQVEFPANVLEDYINRIADDAVLVQPHDFNYEYALEQLLSEDLTQSTSVGNCSKEVYVADQSSMPQLQCQQHDVQPSFDLTQSGTSQLHLNEAPEVTSAPNSHKLGPLVIEEDFLEDFLEMDDLIGPQPTAEDFDKAAKVPENFQLDELDGFCEFDLFEDAAMFLNETGSGEQGQISQSHMSNFEMHRDQPREVLGPADPGHISRPGLNHLEYPTSQSHSYNSVNEIVSHHPGQLNGATQFSELWRNEQQYGVYAPAEANQGSVPSPTPGVVCDVMSGSNHTGLNQNQNVRQDDGTNSWFSSAIWAFVESIPSTPASAAETALVNKAFERMSSFSRLRINTKNMNVAAGNPSATSGSGKTKNGLLCFSVLGVLCAILWVLIGTSVKVFSRYISS